MPTIKDINDQLLLVRKHIDTRLSSVDQNPDDILMIERLVRTQKILVETQISIMVEMIEADSVETLPLFHETT